MFRSIEGMTGRMTPLAVDEILHQIRKPVSAEEMAVIKQRQRPVEPGVVAERLREWRRTHRLNRRQAADALKAMGFATTARTLWVWESERMLPRRPLALLAKLTEKPPKTEPRREDVGRSFGQTLRQWRRKRGLNQREALAILGEGGDQAKVSDWERGKMVPRNERAARKDGGGEMSACDYLSDADTDVMLALNGITVLNELPEPAAPTGDPLRPAYQRLPNYVREMLEKPLRNIRATHPEAVTMLRQRLSILENARQFGSSVKLESRIARTRAVLEHALAIQATPTTEERISDIVIRDDAQAGQVVIKFPTDHTPELRKRIRSAGFCTKGPRRAFRLRKISGGVNTALEDARWLVQEILGED